jgi:hypothetical protein
LDALDETLRNFENSRIRSYGIGMRRIVRSLAQRFHYCIALFLLSTVGLPSIVVIFAFVLFLISLEFGIKRKAKKVGRLLLFYGTAAIYYIFIVTAFFTAIPLIGFNWSAISLIFSVLILLVGVSRLPYTIYFISLLAFIAVLLQVALHPSPTVIYLSIAGIVLIAILGFYTPSELAKIHPLHLSLTILVVMNSAQIIIDYSYTNPEDYLRVVNQKDVSAIFTPEADDELYNQIGRSHMRNIVGGCDPDRYFITGHGFMAPEVLVEYHPREKLAYKFENIFPDEGIAIDCRRMRLYTGSKELIIELDISGARARPVREFPTSTTDFVEIIIDEDRDRLYALSDQDGFVIIDLIKGREIFKRHSIGNVMTKQGDRLMFLSDATLLIYKIGRSGNYISLEGAFDAVSFMNQNQIAAHPTLPYLFANDGFAGKLRVIDLDKKTELAALWLTRNMRYLDMSNDGRFLATVGHTGGQLFIVDVEKLIDIITAPERSDDPRGAYRAITIFSMGRLARRPRFSSEGNTVYLPTTAGGFKVNLDRLKKN